MKNLTLSFFIFLITAISFGQDFSIKGVLVDSISEKPLAFANIYLLGTNTGTTSDENGLFELKVFKIPKFLRFGYVGYKIKDIDYTERQPDTIKLIRQNEQLDEVFLASPKFEESVKIKAAKSRDNIGISNTNNGESPSVLLRYFKKPSKLVESPAFLSHAEFFLFKGMNSDKRDYIFRIRIMSVSEDNKPGYDLIENKTLTGKPGSKISIDLKDERVLISENGFFIGVEGLQIAQNYIRTREFPQKNNNPKTMKMYGPSFKGVESDGPVYYYSGGEWKKLNMPVPAMNIIITN